MAAAIAAPLCRFAVVQAIDWSPLALPLITGVSAVDGEFTVGQPGRYEFALEIDRPPDAGRAHLAECLLGFDRADCDDRPAMRVEWLLESGGLPLAVTPSSAGRFTETIIARSVAGFDAPTPGSYRIHAAVLSNPPDLRTFRPRIVVLPSATLNRDRDSMTAAVWLTSVIVALAGLLLMDGRA